MLQDDDPRNERANEQLQKELDDHTVIEVNLKKGSHIQHHMKIMSRGGRQKMNTDVSLFARINFYC